jgi:hypothetical protein
VVKRGKNKEKSMSMEKWSRGTKKFICHPPPRSREGRDTLPERRGSRWLTRVPLDDVGARIKVEVGSQW